MADGRVPGSPSLQPRSNALLVAALAALANGAALLANIVIGFPLPILLAFTWAVAVVSVLAVTSTGDHAARRSLGRIIGLGAVAGIVATLVYDATKFGLSQLDPSPFNPFEVTRIFGTLLIGGSASPAAIQVAGWAFHLANGITFGIAFACHYARLGRDSLRIGIVGGVCWGLFLETFQLVLYPGWLNIRYLAEFRQISFLAHVVFGLILGTIVPRGLRVLRAPARSLVTD
jgi:hypothetical protein